MITVLVDGSNVVHYRAQPGELIERQRTLTNAVAAWAHQEGMRVHMTFDGGGELGGPGTRTTTSLVVVEASGDKDADHILGRRARALSRSGAAHWVVSDDRQVRAVAGAHAIRIVSAADFLAILDAPSPADASRGVDQPEGPAGSQLRDGLAPDVRNALERLRLGLD